MYVLSPITRLLSWKLVKFQCLRACLTLAERTSSEENTPCLLEDFLLEFLMKSRAKICVTLSLNKGIDMIR